LQVSDVMTGVKMSDASIGLLDQPSPGQARRVRGKWLLSFRTGRIADPFLGILAGTERVAAPRTAAVRGAAV